MSDGAGDKKPGEKKRASADNDRKRAKSDNSNRNANGANHNVLELWVTVFSIVLILFIAGFLIWEGFQPMTPPDITVTAGKPRESGSRYYVKLKVRNAGRVSAREVGLKVTLKNGEKEVESAEATVDWLPGGSTRTPTVVFSEDPARHTMEATVTGFDQP